MGNKELIKLKIVLLLSSLATLVLLGISAFEEHLSGEWRGHQSAYRRSLIENAKTDAARRAAEEMPIAFRQVYLPELNKIDRCITCHISAEDPSMATAELPLKTHSGTLLTHHPVDKFGCTLCHEGQGRAVDLKDAHGEVPHWEAPLLRGEAAYRTCGKCHYENDLFGAEYDLYAGGAPTEPILVAELRAGVEGAEAVSRGKSFVADYGCLGCHKFRGRGGVLGPDITNVGDKTIHDFNFENVEGEHTVENWLFKHFLRPQDVTPDTLMPDLMLTDEEARDLTEYVLSLRRKKAPASHTPVPPRRPSDPLTGEDLFYLFCSACHGAEGQGSTQRFEDEEEDFALELTEQPAELMVPSLNNADTLAVAGDDYFRSIIERGRSATSMIAWGSSEVGGGLLAEEIGRLVEHIRSWEMEGPALDEIGAGSGDIASGSAVYGSKCLGCHGEGGSGGLGPNLNAPEFLAIASDDFLAKSIVQGRRNTGMANWKKLEAREVSDLLAYMRSWSQEGPDKETLLARLDEMAKTGTVALDRGAEVYSNICAACHGPSGEGVVGGASGLANPDFLAAAPDEFLMANIVLAMGTGTERCSIAADPALSATDVVSVVAHVRSWEQAPPFETVPERAGEKSWEQAVEGAALFGKYCASCHGADGKEGYAPDLNNPEFLAAAGDGFLRATIARGREGTSMVSFAKGGGGFAELESKEIEDVVAFLGRWRTGDAPEVVVPEDALGVDGLPLSNQQK